MGTNPDWPFSPQGIYARHNRLYTLPELENLLRGNGLRPVLAKGLTFMHRREWYGPSLIDAAKWRVMTAIQRLLRSQSVRLRRFAEGALIVAEKVETVPEYRPAWLYGAADTVPMAAARAAHPIGKSEGDD
jgi:hypothetical protein